MVGIDPFSNGDSDPMKTFDDIIYTDIKFPRNFDK